LQIVEFEFEFEFKLS